MVHWTQVNGVPSYGEAPTAPPLSDGPTTVFLTAEDIAGNEVGADLEGAFISLSLRSTLGAKVTLRVLANGKPVKFRIGKKKAFRKKAFRKKATRKLKAAKRKKLRLRVSKRFERKAKIRVVASV